MITCPTCKNRIDISELKAVMWEYPGWDQSEYEWKENPSKTAYNVQIECEICSGIGEGHMITPDYKPKTEREKATLNQFKIDYPDVYEALMENPKSYYEDDEMNVCPTCLMGSEGGGKYFSGTCDLCGRDNNE